MSWRARRRPSARWPGGSTAATRCEAWRSAKDSHPAPGTLIATAREQVAELRTFLARSGVLDVPDGEDVQVAPSPGFLRWSSASLWMPGPFESKPAGATYYLTDALRSWPEERQREHLRDLNHPTLWSISMHEVFPGHFLHFQHLRKVESKVRRSTLLAPASYVEGWAHYGEQMMIEAGFGRRDPNVQLGQLAEALVRLARFIVGIKLHADDWSVEQGVRFFQNEAYLEESHARREAERGTFDPVLRGLLRRQADAPEAARRLAGTAGRQALAARLPRCLPRPGVGALLGAAAADARRARRRRAGRRTPRCPSTSTECQACGHRFEVIQKFSDAPPAECPKCGGAVEKLLSSPAIQFKGSGFYLTDYGRGGKSDTAPGQGARSESGDKADKSDKSGDQRREQQRDKKTVDEGREAAPSAQDVVGATSSGGETSSAKAGDEQAGPAATRP